MISNSETSIILCGQCGAKNRIPADRFGADATCGRCKARLDTRKEAELAYILRCTACGTKNRVSAGKLQADAKCGKCSSALDTKAVNAPQPMMLTDMNFESQVMKSPLPVLVYAWSPT